MDASTRIDENVRKLVFILCIYVMVTQKLAQAQNLNYHGNTQYSQGSLNPQSNFNGGNGQTYAQPVSRNYYCTIQTNYYDCIFRDVTVNYGPGTLTFGDTQNTYNKYSVSFINSRMEYLPKSLMDAFPNMETLNANSLQIRSLQPDAFRSASQLKNLYLTDNSIEQIPAYAFEGAYHIALLAIDHNKINFIEQFVLSHMNNLISVYLSFNEIPSLPIFAYNSLLEIANVSHNSLTRVEDNHFLYNSKLQILDLSFNQIYYFNMRHLDRMYSLEMVDVSSNYLAELYIISHVKTLIARNNSIEYLYTHQQDCLINKLNLAQNKLKKQPDLSTCRNLRNLDLSRNLLESFNFDLLQSMHSLTHLNLANNRLFEINVPPQLNNILSIKYLDLSSNMLSTVTSTNILTNLVELYLDHNRLENFDFHNKPNLKHLTLAFNQWDCAALNMKIALKVLDRNKEQCRTDFHNRGICCQNNDKQDTQNFQKLTDLIRETFIYKHQNQKSMDERCRPQIRDQQYIANKINNKIATISNLQAINKPVLQEIALVKDEFKRLNNQIASSQHESQANNDQLAHLAKEVDRWRATYGIEKEGLVKEGLVEKILQRVVQFVNARNTNSDDLLKRRGEEVSASQERGQSKQILVDATKKDLENLKQFEKDLKVKEQELKTERNALLAKVNGNSASLRGS